MSRDMLLGKEDGGLRQDDNGVEVLGYGQADLAFLEQPVARWEEYKVNVAICYQAASCQ